MSGWRAALTASALLVVGHGQGQQQGIPVPKWLSDTGKDLFTDVMNDDYVFGDATCESREKLLKEMAGKGDKDASQYRARVLLDLGGCEFKKENFAKAAMRYASAISEMNVPNEDVLLQRQESAHIPLMRQAADHMKKHALTEGAVALRRTRVVMERNVKAILKHVHKQMNQGGQSAPPLEEIVKEIPGYGKTGQMLPNIVKQIPHALKGELQQMELLDNFLDSLDKKMAATASSLKLSRTRLDKGKSAVSSGVLLYVKALVTDPTTKGENLLAAEEIENDVGKALVKDTAAIDKPLTLVKRGKLGKDCQDGGGLETVCKGLEKVADVISNGFGETRLLVVKAGKKQQLEVCSTNANVGILLATKAGVKLSVKDQETIDLEVGKAVVVDFCLESALEAKEQTPVLFAQAWHPEFAAVERTTELRLRSDGFGLKEDELKAATKVVNDHAKKSWEKTVKAWRKGSALVEKLRSDAAGEADAKKQQEKEAEESKRQQDLGEDEERKKGLEALEKKRAEKKKSEEAAEAKREKRQKVIEQEKAMRDPWLNTPEVKAVEDKIADLKEQRRDANAKLEFDLSNSLTKDISAAERELKKVIKKARKAYKKEHKDGTKSGDDDSEKGKKKEAASSDDSKKESGELAKLKKELEEVKTKKKKASEDENYKEANTLKAKQKDLEAKIKKLEL